MLQQSICGSVATLPMLAILFIIITNTGTSCKIRTCVCYLMSPLFKPGVSYLLNLY